MTNRKPQAVKRLPSHTPIVFSGEDRALVRVLIGWGMPSADIATQVPNPETGKNGITVATLHEHFREEIETGRPELLATAIRTQNDFMTKGRTDMRERVSARLLRHFGLSEDLARVVHVQTDPESTPRRPRS